MKTKTFKIGECCQGGILTAQINKNQVTIIAKEWDHSAGDRRSSDQSNAKEFRRDTFTRPQFTTKMWGDDGYTQPLLEVLNDLTTHYYAEQVYEWIEKQFTQTKREFA